MQRHQLNKLSYDDAIRELGGVVTQFSLGQFVLLDQAIASYQPTADAEVTPTNSIVVAEVAEVSEDGQKAKMSKLRRVYESGGNYPEEGDDSADLAYFSVAVEERIKVSDDLFKRMNQQ
jgi:hypothetical protein